MKNFNRFKGNSRGGDFSRGERGGGRGERANNFRSTEPYRRQGDKGFNNSRTFNDNRRSRRDFDPPNSRGSFNQDRRDSHSGGRAYGGNDRSYPNRASLRDQRSFRNHSPPQRSRGFDSRGQEPRRTAEDRFRRLSPAPSQQTRRRDFPSPSARPRIRHGMRPLQRGQLKSELRTGLITKRTAPAIRTREYIKKIKQALMKLNEKTKKEKSVEPKTPPKDDEKESKNDENDEDLVLDVANDVNFEEDDEEVGGSKNSSAKGVGKNKLTSTQAGIKEEKNEKKMEIATTSGGGNSSNNKDVAREKKSRQSRSPSRETESSYKQDLICIHCQHSSWSVQDYKAHLRRRKHQLAIKRIPMKLRSTLNLLRKNQREKQLEIEANLDDIEQRKSKYCHVCKLYFRQSQEEHQETEYHEKIINFLKPHCQICDITLLTPMKYEMHKATFEHIREKKRKLKSKDDDIDVCDLDLGDFKTLDSVGDVDGETTAQSDDSGSEISDTEPQLGKEYINKIEVFYCLLCRTYLPRSPHDAKNVYEHCKNRKHTRWYWQCKRREEKRKEKEAETKSKEKKDDELKEKDKNDAGERSSKDTEKSLIKTDEDGVGKIPEEDEMNEHENEKELSKKENDEPMDESGEGAKKFTRYFEQPST